VPGDEQQHGHPEQGLGGDLSGLHLLDGEASDQVVVPAAAPLDRDQRGEVLAQLL
jgi:hypothetical protein